MEQGSDGQALQLLLSCLLNCLTYTSISGNNFHLQPRFRETLLRSLWYDAYPSKWWILLQA